MEGPAAQQRLRAGKAAPDYSISRYTAQDPVGQQAARHLLRRRSGVCGVSHGKDRPLAVVRNASVRSVDL